jgi:NADH dehydrogenase
LPTVGRVGTNPGMAGRDRGGDARVPRVAIVGGGFGGLRAARALARAPVRVTLVDRRNHHLFQPLLYQVATAALNPGDIASPIRHVLLRQLNCEVLLAEVVAVDAERKRLVLDDGALEFDFCILATGAAHSYFGHPEWAPLAPSLKTVEDALEIRRRILLSFERAEREPDPGRRGAWMRFVVVGGGPTGVELAGALAEISRHTLARDFRRIRPEDARVILVEASPRVLPLYPPELSRKAERQLERLGVEVRTGAAVSAITEDGVAIGGERLSARTVLWGAGVAASPLARSLGVPLDRSGRVLTEPDLTVPGHPEIYAIGDLAAVRRGDGFVPGLAPAAIQEGKHAARNVVRSLRGLPRAPFRYRDKGSLATIGRAAAVADIRGLRLSGVIAWLAWLLVHIFFLIGFRNRVAVLLQWSWSYLTWGRGARLITDTALRWQAAAERRERPAAASAETPGQVSRERPAPAPRDIGRVHMSGRIRSLAGHGQSAWYDGLPRALLASGEIARFVEKDGLCGVTTNPAIYEKAIVGSGDYEAELSALASRADLDAEGIYERLAIGDVRAAADLLRPVYLRTARRDGYACLEVSPALARDPEGTVAEARRLWRAVGRENVMIKVPGTREGLPAIARLVAEGVNVNVTLLFSRAAYAGVAEAYLSGLEERASRGGDLPRVASVASFFVSRLDALADRALEEIAANADTDEIRGRAQALRGRVAIANAKLAFQDFKALTATRRWLRLRASGAQPQRLLWASTSVEDPRYRDVMYVEELIGPDTVTTMPPATFEAFRDHGQTRPTLESDLDDARQTLAALAGLGVSLDELADRLLREGIRLFADPFAALLRALDERRGLTGTGAHP